MRSQAGAQLAQLKFPQPARNSLEWRAGARAVLELTRLPRMSLVAARFRFTTLAPRGTQKEKEKDYEFNSATDPLREE